MPTTLLWVSTRQPRGICVVKCTDKLAQRFQHQELHRRISHMGVCQVTLQTRKVAVPRTNHFNRYRPCSSYFCKSLFTYLVIIFDTRKHKIEKEVKRRE
jgi:hypothetical protein